MMVGSERAPSNWSTMKAAAFPRRWYAPDVLSNSIGWSSIPTISFTPRRRRGMSLLDTLTVLVVVVIGS